MCVLPCHRDTCADQLEPLSQEGGKLFRVLLPIFHPPPLPMHAPCSSHSCSSLSPSSTQIQSLLPSLAGRKTRLDTEGSLGVRLLSPTPPPPSPVSVLIVSPSGSPFPVSGLDGSMLEYCRPLSLVRLLPARSWSQDIGEPTCLNSLSLLSAEMGCRWPGQHHHHQKSGLPWWLPELSCRSSPFRTRFLE